MFYSLKSWISHATRKQRRISSLRIRFWKQTHFLRSTFLICYGFNILIRVKENFKSLLAFIKMLLLSSKTKVKMLLLLKIPQGLSKLTLKCHWIRKRSSSKSWISFKAHKIFWKWATSQCYKSEGIFLEIFLKKRGCTFRNLLG